MNTKLKEKILDHIKIWLLIAAIVLITQIGLTAIFTVLAFIIENPIDGSGRFDFDITTRAFKWMATIYAKGDIWLPLLPAAFYTLYHPVRWAAKVAFWLRDRWL